MRLPFARAKSALVSATSSDPAAYVASKLAQFDAMQFTPIRGWAAVKELKLCYLTAYICIAVNMVPQIPRFPLFPSHFPFSCLLDSPL